MNQKQNYDKLFSLELERIAQSGEFIYKKPRLLLHACCGPCSSAVLERLADHFKITIFYYNPNIHPAAEYERRLEELAFFLNRRQDKHRTEASDSTIDLVRADYNIGDFFAAVNIEEFPERAQEAERGERCFACYRLRMKKAALYALENGFDYFTTTLSISPHKDSEKINAIGAALERELSEAGLVSDAPLRQKAAVPRYLYADFKKQNGYKRSLEISAEYGLYRQDYCGCIYSKQNSETHRSAQQKQGPIPAAAAHSR
ncbi:epoxyqueuosine reductase QueH [Treponema maltophilum]|uniref:epoxyqueuosine reductase QueH n=1 Tax=Treponema maltophilum TaxID=51160 RepID=UPI003D8ACD88